MHRVSPSHLDRMQKQSETQSLGRVDSWMGENVAGWSDRPPEDREAALRQTAATARRYGIANEGDLAMLTLLLQTVRPSA